MHKQAAALLLLSSGQRQLNLPGWLPWAQTMGAPAAALPVSTGFWAERVCRGSVPVPDLWLKSNATALNIKNRRNRCCCSWDLWGHGVCLWHPAHSSSSWGSGKGLQIPDQRIWDRERVFSVFLSRTATLEVWFPHADRTGQVQSSLRTIWLNAVCSSTHRVFLYCSSNNQLKDNTY